MPCGLPNGVCLPGLNRKPCEPGNDRSKTAKKSRQEHFCDIGHLAQPWLSPSPLSSSSTPSSSSLLDRHLFLSSSPPMDDTGTSIHTTAADEQHHCQWENCSVVSTAPELLYLHLCNDHIGRKSTNNLCLTCKWKDCGISCAKRDHITSHLRGTSVCSKLAGERSRESPCRPYRSPTKGSLY